MLKNTGEELILKVKVEPRSSRSSIVGMYGDSLKVKLTSSPVEGKANKALIKFLAKVLGVRKNRIEIVAGEKSLDKIVAIHDMSAREVQERIFRGLDMEGDKEKTS